MHEFQVRAISKESDMGVLHSRISLLDEAIVRGREAADEAIKQFRQRYGDELGSVTVWDESRQRPAKGWNDGYR